LGVADVNEGAARAALSGAPLAVVREGDRLTVFAELTGARAFLCCSLQTEMDRVGDSDLWVARYRLARLDEATITLIPPAWFGGARRFTRDELTQYRGPNAPLSPHFKREINGQRLQRTLWSEHLQETRRLMIYLPPGHDALRSYPALFMADGGNAGFVAPMIEHMIDEELIPPIVIVGSESGQPGIVEDRSALGIRDLRAADYLPDYEGSAQRFEQHLRFFSEELVDFAVSEFGVARDANRRGVTGFSNGGTFALFAALRRPDSFGFSVALSPSRRPPTREDFAPPPHARFFLSAGLYETNRWRRAATHAETLREWGYNVDFHTPVTGHERDQEHLMLARFLPVAFRSADEAPGSGY
jgi:enterochelin esterase-like enzyme